ncbi:MAG: hypothetical protein KYQ20_01650 [Candidatus Nealsonbacteria bacterium]|nr:hypothetical protein [Candidatus Nealsonbacteria bacterium]
MANQTAKVKNGTITLPKGLQKSWKGADVFIDVSRDTISIKRLTKSALSLKEMMDELRRAARKTRLSKKETEKAIQSVRQKVYK